MMLPFFCGGLGIGLVFSHFGKQAGRIYAFDILGAGVGSLGVIGVVPRAAPPGVDRPHGIGLAGCRDRRRRIKDEAEMADGIISWAGCAGGSGAARHASASPVSYTHL